MPYVPEQQIDEELTSDERDQLIDELARKIVNRRMETPAIMFLEMHKPVSFVASQGIVAASPFLIPIFGPAGVRRYSQLFSTRENVERLIQRIEELADTRDVDSRKS